MNTGDVAPDFALPDNTGTTRTLTDFLTTGPVVLFFYPGANTPICTKEACHFRDLAAEFAQVGATRVGISTDDVETLSGFAGGHQFDYPLLSDSDGATARAYGVKRGLLGKLAPVKRHTFVIDTDRRILAVIANEFNAQTHADQARDLLTKRTV